MKIILIICVLIFINSYSDWNDDVLSELQSIENHTQSTSRWSRLNYATNEVISQAIVAQSNNLGLEFYSTTIDGVTVDGVRGEQLPSGISALVGKYGLVKDNTDAYNNYVNSRQFSNSNKLTLDLSTDAFFDTEFSSKALNTLDSRFFSDDTVGPAYMLSQTETMNTARNIVNRAATIINGYINTQYDDYTFFTINLSSLGVMFINLGLSETNPFQDYVFHCNLVPDNYRNPYLYKLYLGLDSFYNVYYGKFLIQICFSVYIVFLLWSKVLEVFNME